MGIAERKEREKKEMRELIIQAALKLFVEEGYEKTSIRAIAGEIDYSPATIYLYFKDKAEILNAVHKQGFQLFTRGFQQVREIADPLERFRELGRAYLKFAFENPALYDAMFILNAPMQSHEHEQAWDTGKRSHQILEEIVGECINKEIIKARDVQSTAFAVWALVHGIASLYIRGRMRMYEETELETLVEKAYDGMVNIITR